MAKRPGVDAQTPKSAFTKPLTFDLKALFKSLSKGVGHTALGQWHELAADTAEATAAIGVQTEPGELAFLLIRRAVIASLFSLVGDSASQQLADTKADAEALTERLDFSMSTREILLTRDFLERPRELPLLEDLEYILQKWLQQFTIIPATAEAIVARLPSYFALALHNEWRRNAKFYRPLIEALDSPFMRASEREWEWAEYNALLRRRVEESVFDEPFGLSQIFVQPHCYYHDDSQSKSERGVVKTHERRRVVTSLNEELQEWLSSAGPHDSIRVISGGPGSGKSSFARVFASRVASANPKRRVLFVPLHLIDPVKELVDEVGRFVKDEGILQSNPLSAESPEADLLIIFDGLDELASQGKAAAETARAFVREVERTIEKRNSHTVRLRVILSGRELIVQENETEFRRPKQILTLLPYFISNDERSGRHEHRPEGYDDPKELLKIDLRQQWWRQYGKVTGKDYQGLPNELSRPDLDEITAQPLLNYLVALSYVREKVDFTKEVNLNTIYADLVTAVHERGYEKHRPYAHVRHMSLSDFSRVLEEIGLAAWHGDGRSTTVGEIEEHCRLSGVGLLLEAFKEGARSGITRLLAAFFFRQYGSRATGEPTFVFTHKTFGEYLAARRIVRAIERLSKELSRRSVSPDEGWDEREALRHWVQVCGPSPVTHYLHKFVVNEVALREATTLTKWRMHLLGLLNHVLNYGLPIDQLQARTFRDVAFQARNAEEAILVGLNACSRVTGEVSKIDVSDDTAFGAWLKRIQGQRHSADSVVALRCLSYLNLDAAVLHMADLYGADLSHSSLQHVEGYHICFEQATLLKVDFRDARMNQAKFGESDLRGADMREAMLHGADFDSADMQGVLMDDGTLITVNMHDALKQAGVVFEGTPRLLTTDPILRHTSTGAGPSSERKGPRPIEAV